MCDLNYNCGYGKIFTNHMKGELIEVEKQLQKNNVKYVIKNNVLIFDESEICKLPSDKSGYFLPFDDKQQSGFNFYKIYKSDY